MNFKNLPVFYFKNWFGLTIERARVEIVLIKKVIIYTSGLVHHAGLVFFGRVPKAGMAILVPVATVTAATEIGLAAGNG